MKKNHWTRRACGIAASLSLCSCAATFGSGPFAVPIDSEPQGAIVSYRGHDVGRTPCTVSMTTKSDRLTLRLDGYRPQEVGVRPTSNGGWVLLGILLWGPFELFAAAMSDSWTGLSTDPLKVPLSSTAVDGPPQATWWKSEKPRDDRHDWQQRAERPRL